MIHRVEINTKIYSIKCHYDFEKSVWRYFDRITHEEFYESEINWLD
jgi:hypothetical protein